jgi:hypothetical protein
VLQIATARREDGNSDAVAANICLTVAAVMVRSPSFMRRHVASLAVYVVTYRPALLEEAATFTLATIFPAVFDVLGPLFPIMIIAARSRQIGLGLFRLPSLPFFGFGSLLCLAGSAVSHQLDRPQYSHSGGSSEDFRHQNTKIVESMRFWTLDEGVGAVGAPTPPPWTQTWEIGVETEANISTHI